MIWVIIGTATCIGGVGGMILGKLFTEREMTENMEQYGADMYKEGLHQGYDNGYSDAYAEMES